MKYAKCLVVLCAFFSLCLAIAGQTVVHRIGDYKGSYDQNYTTDSLSLDYREKNKKPFDLIANVSAPQLGLPAIVIPQNNPITPAKIGLGKKLFFDRRLSRNNTISCALCHVPEQGFTSNELSTSVGIEGRVVRRNAPTLYNVAYLDKMFHDAREDSLERQVWGPLLAKNEMGNRDFSSVINKIKNLKDYQGLFEQAFAGKAVTVGTVGAALASYQRTLIAAHTNFDKWYYGKDPNALTKQAQTGFKLFVGKAKCVACHRVNKTHALFTDHKLHNTGIGYAASMQPKRDYFSIQVSPGVHLAIASDIIDQVSARTVDDLGWYEITDNPDDRWKYKTPSLRNIAITAPYMHNGSLPSLKKVVEFYDRGGIENELLSPLIKPLHLSDEEKEALVVFLKNLTGDNVDKIVADSFTVPIGDVF